MFEFNETYKFEINNLAFDDMPRDTLNEIFRDAGVTGKFMESFVAHSFPDLCKHENPNNPGFDLWKIHSPSWLPLEVKCLGKTGHACLLPSHMLGKGRKYDRGLYRWHLNQLRDCNGGFIIVDISEFPVLRMVGISAEQVINDHAFSFKAPDGDNDHFKISKSRLYKRRIMIK